MLVGPGGAHHPAAREAVGRRQLAMRLQEEMRREKKAQWMASHQWPGWARRGNCHFIY